MGIYGNRSLSVILKMASTRWLWGILVFFALYTTAHGAEPRVVCYYTNWSVYRPGTARFNPQNINPYLCTHLIYAFGGFTKENTLKPFDKYQDIEKGGYAKFTGLKTYNKNLKTLLAIGGWNEGSTRFSPMVATRERRREFVRNVIKFLRQNRFDGLDLDWEYPAFRDGGKPRDRENYAKLVKELREEFDRESAKTSRPRLLLTMAVPAGIEYIEKGFDVKTLNQYLDWMNLLTYDYHSAFEPAVNHHAPLYPLEEPNEYSVDGELNIDYTIKFYLEKGADPDKLVLGIPTYGRSYTLFNPDAVEIGSPADGPGEQGDATREKGYLAYYEICEALKPKKKKRNVVNEDDEEEEDLEDEEEEVEDGPWTVMYPNPNAMGPVAFKGNQWVGYDDIDIVKRKAEYVAENGLGGIMFWSIDNDDFRGNCHGKPYPLIEAAKEAYISKLGATDNAITERSKVSSTTERRRNRPRTTTTSAKPSAAAKLQSDKRKNTISTTPSWAADTPEPPTTPDPGADFKCKDEGFFPHPRDCKKYFWCLDSGPSNLGIVAHQFTCPSGLFFNKAADSCDFARNVLCKKPSSTTKAPATSKPTTKKPASTSTTTTSTTRRPIKLSSKSASLFRTTSTTTAASVSIEDEIEEQVNGEFDSTDVDAEDPKVIKELIELIRKVGGVEQLEKQLHLAEASSSVGSNSATTTPSSFKKKLYQKVLERTRAKNRFGNNVSEGAQNSRVGPQNAGVEKVREITSTRKERPQYTTINRSRQTNTGAEETADSNNKPLSLEEPHKQARSKIEEEAKVGTNAKPLQYVNIRRARPSTTSTSDTADDTASRYSLFERNEPSISVSENSNSREVSNTKRENSLEYVTIRRQRPTTEEATTVPYQTTEQQESLETIEKEISSSSTQPQYMSIVRSRSTTLAPIEETFASPEPTTVLSVQISSLRNYPPEEFEIPTDFDEPITATISEPSSTTTTITTTTTTTEVPTKSTSAPRRTVLKRRGSTSTPAPTSSTASQVSSERPYTNVRRRIRPLARTNEISLGSGDTHKNDISRKIRSTTPDSREALGNRSEGTPIRSRNRYQKRFQQTDVEDSVSAAASQTPRGQFRPRINRDELISLTPIDNENPVVDSQPKDYKPRRRYRGRPSTTVAEKIDDSEVSAATVEERTPSILSRGRSKFSARTTTETNEASNTVSAVRSRRPALTRSTTRPFTSRTKEFNYEKSVNEQGQNDEPEVVSPRLPTRLPFGKVKSTFKTLDTTIGIQARKLPFPSNREYTTPNTVADVINDEDGEDKFDDITLSESTIEEKEHDHITNAETEKTPKRRIIVKKIRPQNVQKDSEVSQDNLPSLNNEVDKNVTTEDGKQRKLKIIRRRPTTPTVPSENISMNSTVSDEASSVTAVPRVRKIIRKKLKQLRSEDEIKPDSKSEFLAEATTETILNYGEKAKISITIPTTQSSAVTILESELENENKKEQNLAIEEKEVVALDEDKEEDLTKQDISSQKPKVIIDNDKELILSENENSFSSFTDSPIIEEDEIKKETTTKSTTLEVFTARTRLPYRPPKRLFTSSTESSILTSSKTYRRKYNVGSYTSPPTVDRPFEPIRPSTRKPLYTSRPFTRKPYTTLSTTQNIDDEEYYSEEEDELPEEEPESTLVLVPPSKLFTRKPSKYNDEEENENVSPENFKDEEPEEEEEEEEKLEDFTRPKSTTRKPYFRPKVINSNTFRTSSTTELPKRQFDSPQNRTLISSRFGNHSNSNETKKRVQNVPVGYNASKSQVETALTTKQLENVSNDTDGIAPTTTILSLNDVETTTEDDDYLSMDEINETTLSENQTTLGHTTFDPINTETTTSEMDIDTEDYLEFQDNSTTTYPSTLNLNTETESIAFTTEISALPQFTTVRGLTTSTTKISYIPTETVQPETTTSLPQGPRVVKTQFDKLFSVSRVVEVSSKLDKHKLNKNNETRLIESGNVKQEKKPTEDKIGEVSRFSLIKIVEDEIPIYLTKLGHVYPVENPPYNPIRIDEARNARALTHFADSGRENLIASESMNEPFRHINNLSLKSIDTKVNKEQTVYVSGDDFLAHINERPEEKRRSEQSINYQPFPQQWQFVPAAYENERKAAKSFEIITPRNQLTDPSTLPLEGLFKTENPMLMNARKINSDNRQPFVVYSAANQNEKNIANFVKLHVLKPETGKSIKTYVRGQEFNGGSSREEKTVKYPVSVSIIPKTSKPPIASSPITTPTVTASKLTTTKKSIKNEGYMTTVSYSSTEDISSTTLDNTAATTTDATTIDFTTQRSKISNDALNENAKRRPKFAFPRRPTVKTLGNTRTNTSISAHKINTASSSKTSPHSNKTTGFNPSKSRFTANRAQNVPVETRSKKIVPKLGSRTTTTESPRIRTTTERKFYFKPIRPNLSRPAFVPRKSLSTTTQVSRDT